MDWSKPIKVWLDQHRNVWRTTALGVLLLAMLGPWLYDVINVPAEYECSAPFVRLEGDFCGKPISGIAISAYLIGSWAQMMIELLTGKGGWEVRIRDLIFSSSVALFWLPVVITLLLARGQDGKGRQALRLSGWALAAGVGLWLGVASHSGRGWALWGIWLYLGTAVSALVLEAMHAH